MSTSTWFDDLPVVGALPPEKAAATLRETGEDEVAEALEHLYEGTSPGVSLEGQKHWLSFLDKPWLYANHVFGYLAPTAPGDASNDPLPISPLNAIHTDPLLKHTRVKITLDRFRVANYPGRGSHHILVHFFAQNQVANTKEDLHFSATYRVSQGDQVAIRGYPIFVGLSVSNEGIRLRCRTINVKNDQDEALLNVLESKVFTSGLHLVSTLQPAIAPLSELAYGLTEMVAKRHRNISVQDFDLGLDFSNIPTGARLAEGAYLAVQVPESEEPVWDWEDWIYHPSSGQVVKQSNYQEAIPYNYLVFSIRRYEGT